MLGPGSVGYLFLLLFSDPFLSRPPFFLFLFFRLDSAREESWAWDRLFHTAVLRLGKVLSMTPPLCALFERDRSVDVSRSMLA